MDCFQVFKKVECPLFVCIGLLEIKLIPKLLIPWQILIYCGFVFQLKDVFWLEIAKTGGKRWYDVMFEALFLIIYNKCISTENAMSKIIHITLFMQFLSVQGSPLSP